MASKSETAQLLRSLGFSYLEIARELYPKDYQKYLETKDRRLYERLKTRVKRLVKYGEGTPHDGRYVPPSGMYPQGLELDDTGGERNSMDGREHLPTLHPRTRKAGLRGYERQVIEYEQLLYHYYSRYVRRQDPNGVIWATAKWLHGQSFSEYWGLYSINVWSPQRAPKLAKAYAYTILSVAGLLHGMAHIRIKLSKVIEPTHNQYGETMRAINIAIFIFILSLSISAVKEAYGLPYNQGPMWNVTGTDIAEAGRVEQDQSIYGQNVFSTLVSGIKALVKIIAGAALLGSTLDTLSPYPLPSTLTVGLNVLGSTTALLAMAQFVRGIGTRVMD
ncbi:MAG: hypothetical protein GSR85_11805 [Desulfurococcales archaeon]|nr:hypothetical protein [Desulfurococcales archaeon]